MTFKLTARKSSQAPLAAFVEPAGARRLGYDDRPELVVVYFPGGILDRIFEHARAHPYREVGGYLFGRAFVAGTEAVVVVDGHFAITADDATLVSFRFAVDDSVRAEAHRGRHFPATEFVGWYHTHPGHGVFMSGTDRATQLQYFRPFHRVAVVVDPARREFAAFVGDGDDVRALASIKVIEGGGELPQPLPPAALPEPLPDALLGGDIAAPLCVDPSLPPPPPTALLQSAGPAVALAPPAPRSRVSGRRTALYLGVAVLMAVVVAWGLVRGLPL
jgi:proteasome lid subunit RPN8/RPN11